MTDSCTLNKPSITSSDGHATPKLIPLRILLIGTPNKGKSLLFNAMNKTKLTSSNISSKLSITVKKSLIQIGGIISNKINESYDKVKNASDKSLQDESPSLHSEQVVNTDVQVPMTTDIFDYIDTNIFDVSFTNLWSNFDRKWIQDHICTYDMIMYITDINELSNTSTSATELPEFIHKIVQSSSKIIPIICIVNKIDMMNFFDDKVTILKSDYRKLYETYVEKLRMVNIQICPLSIKIARIYGLLHPFTLEKRLECCRTISPIDGSVQYNDELIEELINYNTTQFQRISVSKINDDFLIQLLKTIDDNFDATMNHSGYNNLLKIIKNTFLQHEKQFINNHIDHVFPIIVFDLLDTNDLKGVSKYREVITQCLNGLKDNHIAFFNYLMKSLNNHFNFIDQLINPGLDSYATFDLISIYIHRSCEIITLVDNIIDLVKKYTDLSDNIGLAAFQNNTIGVETASRFTKELLSRIVYYQDNCKDLIYKYFYEDECATTITHTPKNFEQMVAYVKFLHLNVADHIRECIIRCGIDNTLHESMIKILKQTTDKKLIDFLLQYIHNDFVDNTEFLSIVDILSQIDWVSGKSYKHHIYDYRIQMDIIYVKTLQNNTDNVVVSPSLSQTSWHNNYIRYENVDSPLLNNHRIIIQFLFESSVF